MSSLVFNSKELLILSKYLETTLTCPITLDALESPYISPCGHTFNYSNICKVLKFSNKCPLDREPLTIDSLIKNQFASDLIEKKIMSIVLSNKAYLGRKHSINGRPLLNDVKLSCGHTFSQQRITFWRNINRETCPRDGKKFAPPDDITYDIKKSEPFRKKYFYDLKIIQSFNSKIIDYQLDDRNSLIEKISELTQCPISKKTIVSPVIGTCGHTFDRTSIHDASSCPLDGSTLRKSEVVPNRIAKDILDYLSAKLFQKNHAHPFLDREGEKGALLLLKPETTLDTIEKIGKSLGLLTQKKPSLDCIIYSRE